MNRKQQIVSLVVVLMLVLTWLFPHWIPRYKEPEGEIVPLGTVYPRSDFYAFLFTESGVTSRIDWARMILTDLIIIAAGTSVVYVLRSKS
jgi:hypothetical protein